MTLPTILAGLAARLPQRVQVVDSRTGGKKALGRDSEAQEWITLAFWGSAGCVTHSRPRDLLALLIQECAARGWQWTLKCGEATGRYTARVYRGAVHQVTAHHGMADTPAGALAQAVLSALEGQ